MLGASHLLTFAPGDEAGPVWSPDGSRVAFASNRQGIFDLYQKDASGAGRETLLLKSRHWKFPTDWSPDGRFLLYYELNPEGRDRDLWVLPLFDGAPPMPLLQTRFNETDAVFSPDGKWFAYSSDESGKQEIYVQSFPPSSGKWMVSSGGGSRPKWPRGGKELFYLAPDNRITAVETTTDGVFRAGIPRPLFQTNIAEDFRVNFAVTANGRRFLIPTASDKSGSPSATVVLNWTGGVKQ